MCVYSEGGRSMAQHLYSGLSYEQVVQKYADAVLAVCMMHLGSPHDADDCFQNTFLKLYTDPPEFREEEHIKAWLLRVAINECKNFIRDNRRNVPLDSARDAAAFHSDDQRDISWALMRLEPDYREVLYLYYVERYKVREIGEILDKNPNTVKTMLSRGRKRLKKIYGGDDQ